jgi:hypothetical protein
MLIVLWLMLYVVVALSTQCLCVQQLAVMVHQLWLLDLVVKSLVAIVEIMQHLDKGVVLKVLYMWGLLALVVTTLEVHLATPFGVTLLSRFRHMEY